jgi:voltage-gated potassium channel
MNGRILQNLKIKKVQQKIQQLKNHTVVCGYGRNGKQAIEKLRNFDMPCVVIEKRKDMIEDLERHQILYIEGDATDDDSLEKAAIKNAHSLITALPSDADNLFVVLSARQLNKDLTIIARASLESSYKKLKIAGANNVIMPDYVGGMHMASLVVTPDIVEFVDRLTVLDEGTPNLEEIDINKLPAEFLNKTILDLDLRNLTGCTVIGFKTANDDYIINPEPSMRLTKDSILIVIGRSDQIQKIHKIF